MSVTIEGNEIVHYILKFEHLKGEKPEVLSVVMTKEGLEKLGRIIQEVLGHVDVPGNK
ncbi:hypothetical protein [Pyrococcus kukulkanii]